MRFRLTPVISGLLLALCACGDQTLTPTGPVTSTETGLSAIVGGAPKFWETGAATGWNQLATVLATRRTVSVNRLFAYLHLAQFRAAEAAVAEPGPHPPVAAAIGGASVVVLSAFYPLDVVELEAALDSQEAADPWPGAKHADFSAGESLGRAIGGQVNTFALADLVGLTDPGVPPIGPGYWIWNGGPIARGFLGARPFYLSSTDELRPLPPPVFGSQEYLAALAEVRQISDTRTTEQTAIAQYWNLNQSPTNATAMNEIARELIGRYRRSDRDAAKTLFLMHSAVFDALIGCFDAKYFYWFIRPPQADPAITLAVGMPPHPSYPSGHSCVSGAYTAVLSDAFPSERARLAQVAEEASLSRLYAGIHYRFDMQAGLALGRAAAARALSADLDEVAGLP